MNQKQDWKVSMGKLFFKFRAISPFPFIIAIFLFFRPYNLGDRNALVNIIGFIILLLGLTIRIVTVGYSRVGTSGRENFLRADDLNTDGFYSLVRNPLYLGNFVIYNGLLILFSNPYAFIFFNAFLLIFYYFIILSEENYLKQQFGEVYESYWKKTPAIIPNFKNYHKPKLPFSLKKVLFKEKNTCFYSLTLLMIILIFKEYNFKAGIIEKSTVFIIGCIVLLSLNLFLVTLKRHYFHNE